ncbi:MAG: hypothetical protein Q4F60_03300 [Candidatus Saccharibacteria bacterium]|nr:hypothetical protein [Candidatus Saccharibacteria bacterium]
MESNKPNNKVIISLLAVLIVMVAGFGCYFVIRDVNRSQDNKDNTSQTTDDKDKGSSDQPASSDDPSIPTSTPSSDTPTPEPAQVDIVAGITYAEVRSNNFFIEAQVDGQVNGTCDISVVPTNGGQGHHETAELEISNKISVCNEYFSLKGMNPGEHKVTVVINAADGRTKTLEQIVKI